MKYNFWYLFLRPVFLSKIPEYAFWKLRTHTGGRVTTNRRRENKFDFKHRNFKPGFKKCVVAQ